MGGEYFDVLKSMRARMACMPGPTRPSAEADEQHGAVEVPVHSAPEPFLDTAAAEALPQPVPPAHSTQPAAGTIKSGELRHRDGSQLAEHAASPSGASEMSSLSSLQEPLPGRVDDFDATLELSRRPIPAHSPKEAPQKATSKPEQSHAVADAPAADAPPASAADAAPAAASKAVSQPAQAGAIHGLGWSLKAPLGSAAAKPSLSSKQWHHVRMWSFGDGKISARRTAPKPSASAAKKARVPAVPDGATKSANGQAAAGPHKLPRQPQQHGFVPRPQQPPNNAQHPAPPMQQQQLPPPASAPGMPLSQAAQLRLPLLKIPPRSQAATSTAMRVKVPARPGAPRQGPSSVAAPAPKAGSLKALAAHVQPQPSAIQQQQDTSADEPGLMHPSWMDEGLEAAERLQLLACDEVLPETDLPLRPQPRVNLARNLGLLRPPSLLTAPSVTQKFQERLTAAMSSPDRHATAFPLGTPGAGGSAFADARHAANNGAPSGSSSAFASVSQPRRKSAWEAALEAVIEEEGLLDWHPDSAGHHAPRGTRAGSHEQESNEHGGAAATRRGGGRPRRAVRAPVGFFEEPDFSTGGDTETDSEARRPPMRRAAKSRRVGRPSKAPAQPSLPCSRVATFQDVQRWKRGLPKERKPAPASRAAPCQSPNRRKTVKKQQSGLVIIGRRSLNAHAAVIAAKKKMGRFNIRRSDISGLGVFTLEFCEAGELLMECVGEVLRRPVASMREAAAIERGINDVACYVFALDADHVVDTTSSGNIARFVNHSCSPNCVATAIDVKGARHIFLIAARQLAPGEELTYDYSLSAPDTGSSATAQSLIPCNCQSPNCFGYI